MQAHYTKDKAKLFEAIKLISGIEHTLGLCKQSLLSSNAPCSGKIYELEWIEKELKTLESLLSPDTPLEAPKLYLKDICSGKKFRVVNSKIISPEEILIKKDNLYYHNSLVSNEFSRISAIANSNGQSYCFDEDRTEVELI